MCLEFLQTPVFNSNEEYNAWYKTRGHVDFESFGTFAPMDKTSDATCKLFAMRLGNALVHGPRFVDPGVVKDMHLPDFGFLIEHTAHGQTRRFLFDLGMRETTKPMKEYYEKKRQRFQFWCDKGPERLLPENGVALDSLEAIMTSHTHFECVVYGYLPAGPSIMHTHSHVGDISAFPTSIELIQGVESFESPEELADEFDVPLTAIKERKLTVLKRDDPRWKAWGAFMVIDWLGDGSMLLVSSPGHKNGHMSLVVKVSNEGKGKYVVLCGDTCHHVCNLTGELKIAVWPAEESDPNRLHSVMVNLSEAYRTMARSRRMDKEDNCFAWIAHDHSINKLLPKGDFIEVTPAVWEQVKNRTIDYE